MLIHLEWELLTLIYNQLGMIFIILAGLEFQLDCQGIGMWQGTKSKFPFKSKAICFKMVL